MSDYQRGTSASPQTARAVLARVPAQAHTPGNPLAKASFTTAGPANSNITYTARNLGTAGNSITVAYVVAGANTPLTIGVVGNAITVNVATSGASAATSTGNQVLAALTANAAAMQLVDAQLKTGDTGAGVVAAIGATALSGGTSLAAVGGTSNAPLPRIPPIHYTYGR